MQQQMNINDLVQQIGEALGLIVTAIAQEHDAPMQLLDAMNGVAEQCRSHPQLYSPVTQELVLHAAKGLEGAIQAAAAMRGAPN